jgi:cell division septation protein DedD
MTLSSGAGLPQARDALVQMDKYVPPAQRAQAQSLARELEAGAKAQRSSELAAVELGSRPAAPAAVPVPAPAPVVAAVTKPPVAQPVTPVTLAAAPKPAPKPAAPAAARKQGNWRVQLGAFGVAANADRMWGQLSGHAALSGTKKTLVPSGKVTRLLATGFANEGEASRACAALKREGKACVVAGQG